VRRQRRQAEEDMRISEYKYRHLFESLGDAAFLIDPETGRIFDSNPQAEPLLGRPRAEILGMRGNQLHPPQKDQAQPLTLLRGESREQRFETKVLRKDGTIVPVHVSVPKIDPSAAGRAGRPCPVAPGAGQSDFQCGEVH
jgi:PAS domain S-box-containing protein